MSIGSTSPSKQVKPGSNKRRQRLKKPSTTKSSSRRDTTKEEDISKTSSNKKPPKILAQKRPTLHKPVQCWAHTQSGKRCKRHIYPRENEPIPIPYCTTHLNHGDGALKVVPHPFAGKCLVARHTLPPNYKIAFWGYRGPCKSSDKEDRAISYYPPDKESGKNKEADGTIKSDNYNGVLNPGGTGDLIQYAACPGPGERQNMRSTFQYWGVRNGEIGGLEFVTLETIPQNTQLCHWYGPHWWSARGVKRRDVGTKRYPAPKRCKKMRGTK